MRKSENAVGEFSKGLNCAQAVLLAFNDELNLNRELAIKIASGFGSGMCQGEACGAVSGAIMVLNLKYGNSTAEDRESKDKIFEKVREFSKEFKNINGSIVCKNLLGCNLNQEGMREYARNKGLFKEICPKLIKDAVEILEKIG